MAKPTLKGLQAQVEELSIKLKTSIARENALRARLEKIGTHQSFEGGLNLRNPAFRAAYDKLRAEQPNGAISQAAIVAAMQPTQPSLSGV